MFECYDDVIQLVHLINSMHFKFSTRNKSYLNYNLKSNQVKLVVNDNVVDQKLKLAIDQYKELLNRYVGEIVSELRLKFPNYFVRCRIKQAESISEKLLYYTGAEHENGNVSLNKCLNDFLGLRIIVPDFLVIWDRLENDLKSTNMRARYRELEGYRAIHVYFKNGNNKFFPWELQIWNEKYAETNELSHKKHKQKRKYIGIPKGYYDADLERRG